MDALSLGFLMFTIGCGLLHLLMVGWLCLGWRRAGLTESHSTDKLPPISVIMAARNELPNLTRYLPKVCEQEYPHFEVIVAINETQDESASLLRRLQQTYPNLRFVDLGTAPSDWAPKKWAIRQAAAIATHEHLAFIDADCEPEEQWLIGMGTHFAQGNDWVLGLGGYRSEGTWLNRWVRYETLYTALQYIGAASWGFPYMAVGRNLGYHRRYVLQGDGMAPWQDSLSGDDDLMVNAYAKADKTAVMTKPGTRTWSEAPRSWTEWFRQKTRHVSASSHYSLTSRVLLGGFHLSHMFFIGGCLMGICFWDGGWLWGICYAIFVFLKAMLLLGPAKEWQERHLLVSLFSLEFSYFLYNLSVVPLGLIKRPEWTNRTPKYPKTPKKTEN